MKRLDKFILKGFIGPFFAILFVVLFILVMQFLWLYIDELVGKGLGVKVVAEFLMWGSFTILPLALPLATLLASMMTIGQLSENVELTAMKAAGISLARILTPLFVVACIITIGAFFTANDLVSYSYNKIYTLHDDINRTKEEIKIPPGIFYDGIDGYILRVEDSDDETGMMHGIMVYDHTAKNGNTTMTIADSAVIKMSQSKDYLTFTLFNGVNYQENNVFRTRDTSIKLERIRFNKQELLVPLANYSFEKTDSARFGDQAKAMNLSQLREKKDTLMSKHADIHRVQMHALASKSVFDKSRQLDTAFLALNPETFHADNFCEWEDLDKKAEAYKRALGKSEQMKIDLISSAQEQYETTFYLRRVDLEILYKFSVALACLILFFIGAPLGALIRKGGLGATAIIAVLFFVLYWVVGITGEKLAKDGVVSAFNGRFIAFYVLTPIGAFLTWKAIHDSPIVNMEGFKSGWRKIRTAIVGIFRKPRIVYMGTPEFAIGPLEALLKNKYKVVGVVTVADKPSGRGLQINESAVKKYATAHGIPVLQPEKLKDPEFLKQLAAFNADLFVVVAFRMLPEEVWKMPRLGTFNLHAALLPQYRGAAPINWAVINGEAITGVTTFMIDKDIDTGGIILRQDYRIKETDTAGDVHDALMELGSTLVVETVQGILEKSVETRVQRSFIQGSEVLKPAPKITRETCHINWNASTKSVYNLIRGLSPFPTAWTELAPCAPAEGEGPQALKLKIFFGEKWSADQCSAAGAVSREPGTIISDGKNYLAIATADGAINITDLQLAGKKRMDTKAFLLGFRDPQSYKAIC